MRMFVLCFFAAACPGCADAGGSSTWRASTDNGDKPGIGIEITAVHSKVSCHLYLLDPNAPHDFTRGKQLHVTIERQDRQNIFMSATVSPTQTDKLHLHLDAPLHPDTDEVAGVLKRTEGNGTPTEYKFVRIKK